MKQALRLRDAGLQPERTAMSWHRTVFSALALALLTTRTGFTRGNPILASMGALSTFISLVLCIISIQRQKRVILDIPLISHPTILAKRLICIATGLNAFAIALHSLITIC
ncbi:DUF202 domain-containing protein [Salmonella enterica]|nr:DUF202 domain-containing protein [Salmonella enterica]ECJ5919035.1 DUF202 domain-containing protein [Salmonella enterica subsp. salamae]HCM1832447.1 DUF202 domain-containing protein [Salmonella enterica subsp. salamae serovar 48:z81:z39]HCM1882348.1 DUF202 domain-containing protein [Salmonella enterica subsp. salamae serovar 60:z10:z39]EAN4946072.1 DUF202 domain-containing protein [Salmonella enterica]